MADKISRANPNRSEPMAFVRHRETKGFEKNNPANAELEPRQPASKRKLGLLKGKLEVPDRVFFESDEEIEELFHGDKPQ